MKRATDVVFSALALICLSPLLMVVAAAIYAEDRHSVLFRQKRIGRHGTTFELLKFRSMPVNAGDLPSAAARQLRITRVGRIIRRTNIDELPQLINILRGEMSLVGPRPPLPSQTELISLRAANGSLACLPGLTGLAQVNSFDGMPVSKKAEWDGVYAKTSSLKTDMLIILRTVRYLFSPPPVY